MTDIEWSLEEKDIEWVMHWNRPDKGDEVMFEEEKALAHLLINGVVFTNSHWWEDAWPDAAKRTISIIVNCNDVFAWGSADGEELPHAEIENLYRMWRKDPVWGPSIWCIKQRNQMPQKPVEEAIRKAGIWDLDALDVGSNTMDAEVQAMFRAAAPAILASIKEKEAQGIVTEGRDIAGGSGERSELEPGRDSDAPNKDLSP